MLDLDEIRTLIARHDELYYNSGDSPVADAVYDGWKALLREHCPEDPLLKRIGAPVPEGTPLTKVKHKHHMGSLNNAMNEEEFLIWHEKMADAAGTEVRYNVSFKMDGGSVELVYHDGDLVQASTRGDGQFGEDITANALKMKGVPRRVIAFTGFVRGEVMLFNEEWEQLDPDQLSNPRNLGNGITRRKDGDQADYLTFVAFRIFDRDGQPLGDTESEMLENARKLGFTEVHHVSNCTNQDVLDLYRHMQALPFPDRGLAYKPPGWPARANLPFEIDGLVVKLEDFKLQEQLGESNNRPKGQIAFKFPAQMAFSTLIGVDWSVGHTGAIVPTAVLEPVSIGGVYVTRSSLCNMDEVTRLGIAIHDIVDVYRAGDVIPKILGVHSLAKDDRQMIHAPTKCPVCEGAVGKKQGVKGTDGVHLFCLNPQCEAQALGKIKTWVAKLDIQGLGDVFLEELFNLHHIRYVSDLYRIGPGDIAKVTGTPRAKKIIAEIQKKRNLSLSDFLGSLGIDGLGRRRVILVQQAQPGGFDTLEDWTSGKLVQMANDVGMPNVARYIYDQIHEVLPLIQQLLDAGVTITKTKTEKPVMSEKKEGQLTFVLTGTFPVKKEILHAEITAAGHLYTESYSKSVDFVVASDPSSNSGKIKKAVKDGIPVITEVKLRTMIAQHE